MKELNLAPQPIEPPEYPVAPEKWVQEEEKLRNERREGENQREKLQRLHPGLDLKRFYL